MAKYREAIGDFDDYLARRPNSAKAFSYRADCYSELGDTKQALADYQDAARFYEQSGETGSDYDRVKRRIAKLSLKQA